MFEDMQNKLLEMQQQLEATKKRLDEVTVEAEAGEGAVKVTCNANMKVTDIAISEDLLQEGDKEALEDLLVTATNRALASAKNVQDAEMKGAAKGFLPNIPGLG